MKLFKLAQRYPGLLTSVQTGLLMASGDIISQIAIEKRKIQNFSWIRPVRFFSVGFIFVAPSLRVWYGFLDRKFPIVNLSAVLKKVVVDQAILAPCFLATFLTVIGLTQNKSIEDIKFQITENYVDILTTNWMVWPAVQIFNFSLIPLRNQVLVVQVFALFWNTYIAWKTNQC